MTSFGSYLLGAAQLAVLVAGFGLAAYWLRARLLPGWRGAPARLVEAIVAVALVTVVSEVLGTFGLLYAGALLICAVLVALAARYVPTASGGGQTARGGELGLWAALVAIVVIAIVAFDWAVTTKHALDTGIFNFDSLWYHMPFSASIFQSHSTTGMDHVETVFVNWFYPQNSELLHAVGMLMTGRDTLSLFINFGWLAVAFLAAYCVGRPYGRGIPAVIAAAILAGCHTLVVREPGAAKNDLMAAALLLAGIAILIEAWNAQPDADAPADEPATSSDEFAETRGIRGKVRTRVLYGWPLAAAGLAVGLAAGTKVTVLALAGALSIAVLVLAPAGKRWKAAGWWFVPALIGGGYWYLRNLIVAGNPIPQVTEARPDHPAASRSPAGRPPELRHHPLRDRHRRLAPLLLAGPAQRVRRALAAGPGRRRRRLPPRHLRRTRQAGPLARRRRPLRPRRLPLHAARGRRGGRRTGRLRDQRPLRHPGAAGGARPGAAAALPRPAEAPVGADRGAGRRLPGHRPSRPRPARQGADLRARLRDRLRLRADADLAGPPRRPADPGHGGRPRRARGRLDRPRLPGRAPLPEPPLRQRQRRNLGPRDGARQGLRLDPRDPRLAHRPGRHDRGLRRLRVLRAGHLQPRPLPRRKGPPRRLQRDPDLRSLPRRGQRSGTRLPGDLALPQLPPLEQADRLTRGPLAARLRRRPPALPRKGSHRLAGDRSR